METLTARSRRATGTAGVAGLLAAVLLLAGCGTDEPEAGSAASGSSESAGPSESAAPSSEASASPGESPSEPAASEPEGTVVEVRIEGGDVTPKGERVPVAVGEPVTFRITSDTSGEMHVHSVPESELAFGRGTTEETVTVETPGLVEVELHDPDVTVVQLEAR